MLKLVALDSRFPIDSHKPPVLFVPGAFTGAWLWQGPLVQAIQKSGFQCYAISFSGHHSKRSKSLNMGLKDYDAELTEAVARLPEKPFLVGYSLGGLVSYRYLREHTLPGALLLAAVPPDGLWRSLLSLATNKPFSAAKMLSLVLYPPVRYLGQPPEGLFSRHVSQEEKVLIRNQLRAEPLKALLQASVRNEVIEPVNTPIKLLGFEGDHIIPAKEVSRSAELLKSPCNIYSGMSHSPMVEPEAARVGKDIADWFTHCLKTSSVRATPRQRAALKTSTPASTQALAS